MFYKACSMLVLKETAQAKQITSTSKVVVFVASNAKNSASLLNNRKLISPLAPENFVGATTATTTTTVPDMEEVVVVEAKGSTDKSLTDEILHLHNWVSNCNRLLYLALQSGLLALSHLGAIGLLGPVTQHHGHCPPCTYPITTWVRPPPSFRPTSGILGPRSQQVHLGSTLASSSPYALT